MDKRYKFLLIAFVFMIVVMMIAGIVQDQIKKHEEQPFEVIDVIAPPKGD